MAPANADDLPATPHDEFLYGRPPGVARAAIDAGHDETGMASDWIQLLLGLAFLLVWGMCSQIFLRDQVNRADRIAAAEDRCSEETHPLSAAGQAASHSPGVAA